MEPLPFIIQLVSPEPREAYEGLIGLQDRLMTAGNLPVEDACDAFARCVALVKRLSSDPPGFLPPTVPPSISDSVIGCATALLAEHGRSIVSFLEDDVVSLVKAVEARCSTVTKEDNEYLVRVLGACLHCAQNADVGSVSHDAANDAVRTLGLQSRVRADFDSMLEQFIGCGPPVSQPSVVFSQSTLLGIAGVLFAVLATVTSPVYAVCGAGVCVFLLNTVMTYTSPTATPVHCRMYVAENAAGMDSWKLQKTDVPLRPKPQPRTSSVRPGVVSKPVTRQTTTPTVSQQPSSSSSSSSSPPPPPLPPSPSPSPSLPTTTTTDVDGGVEETKASEPDLTDTSLSKQDEDEDEDEDEDDDWVDVRASPGMLEADGGDQLVKAVIPADLMETLEEMQEQLAGTDSSSAFLKSRIADDIEFVKSVVAQ